MLDGFFETGSEGTHWVLDTGAADPVFIRAGDRLKVFGYDGKVVFNGKIVCDTKTGWTEYPQNPGYGQQLALNFWVHWIQKGWKPDAWARLFIRHWLEEGRGKPQLRAELIQKASRPK